MLFINFISYIMKQLVIFFSFLLASSISLLADEANQIRIEQVPKGGTHFNFPVPADQPDVYYDTVNQQIIIDGDGEVTYYDVEIASVSTWTVVISTQVNGYYDTIDVSSLPAGEYCITIDSPTGNSFEGFFDTY